MRHKRVIAVLVMLLLACAAFWYYQQGDDYRALSELPGISPAVLTANGKLIKIEEPILFHRKTQTAFFVITILDTRNFGDGKYLSFGGDARTLEHFVREIEYVNRPSNTLYLQGPWQATKGGADGIASLVEGVVKIVKHPLDSMGELGTGAAKVTQYAYKALWGEVKPLTDIGELASAYYLDACCQVAGDHELDFLDLKTEQARAALHNEANARIAGRGAFEVALLLLPFSEIKYGSKAAEAGRVAEGSGQLARLARSVKTVEVLADAGKVDSNLPKLVRYSTLFEKTAVSAVQTAERLQHAEKAVKLTKPLATLGKAATTDYQATFFGAHPELAGKVVIHHAIEQQVLKHYPGILTLEELHSLENLRGIPKAINSRVHLSQIAKEWNEFYRETPAGVVTKQKLLQKASEIDFKYGHLFTPEVR